MLHRSLAFALPFLVALLLAGCGGEDGDVGAAPAEEPVTTEAPAQPPATEPPAEPPPATEPPVEPPVTTEAPEPAFPVTIDAENGPVVIEERPDRIVSLSATATESLFAIGAGDQVVAVDDQSNYPAEAPTSDLSGFTPNIEAIAAYEPDLVVAGFDPGGLVDGLERVGVPVFLQLAATDLSDAYEQIEELGAATGHPGEAETLVAAMDVEIDELAAGISADVEGLTVFHEISPDFFSATSETFIGSVYQLLGLENIADEVSGAAPDYPQLSAEYIVSADPDLIVLSDTKCCDQTAETVAARPGWDQMTAVVQGHIVPVDDDIASRWGPRTVDFVEVVAQAVSAAGG